MSGSAMADEGLRPTLCSIKGKTSPVVLAVSAWVKQYIYIFSTPSASSSYVVVVPLPILPQNIIMLGIKL